MLQIVYVILNTCWWMLKGMYIIVTIDSAQAIQIAA